VAILVSDHKKVAEEIATFLGKVLNANDKDALFTVIANMSDVKISKKKLNKLKVAIKQEKRIKLPLYRREKNLKVTEYNVIIDIKERVIDCQVVDEEIALMFNDFIIEE
jgi:hypothetical protein